MTHSDPRQRDAAPEKRAPGRCLEFSVLADRYALIASQSLEVQAHPRRQRPLPGQLVVIVERIQFVILIVDVEKAERYVAVVSAKTESGIGVQLENFIAGDVRRITDIALPRPISFEAPEPTGRMIVNRENLAPDAGLLSPGCPPAAEKSIWEWRESTFCRSAKEY